MNINLPLGSFENELAMVLTKTEFCGAKKVMIAGGAVRDALLGRPINDFDVFYQGTLNIHTLNSYFPNVEYVEKDIVYANENWKLKYEATHKGIIHNQSWKVQFIEVKTNIESHLKTFCASISKVAYTKSGLFLTNEFMDTLKTDTVLLTDCPDFYLEKLKAKFPTLKYIHV